MAEEWSNESSSSATSLGIGHGWISSSSSGVTAVHLDLDELPESCDVLEQCQQPSLRPLSLAGQESLSNRQKTNQLLDSLMQSKVSFIRLEVRPSWPDLQAFLQDRRIEFVALGSEFDTVLTGVVATTEQRMRFECHSIGDLPMLLGTLSAPVQKLKLNLAVCHEPSAVVAFLNQYVAANPALIGLTLEGQVASLRLADFSPKRCSLPWLHVTAANVEGWVVPPMLQHLELRHCQGNYQTNTRLQSLSVAQSIDHVNVAALLGRLPAVQRLTLRQCPLDAFWQPLSKPIQLCELRLLQSTIDSSLLEWLTLSLPST